ncbi:MAG TPA: efflux RND transporter periplasmic adaptor subunit [Blastocatellia bacterium]|nr:efflux RND transporter periplasmic adaptor subunit [Blastocatellia bacterium]
MNRKVLSGLAIVTLFAGGYWWFTYGGQKTADNESATGKAETEQAAVATVKVAPIKRGTVLEEIAIYGTVVPAAGALQIFSVPYESRVRRIFVTEAQRVSAEDILLEVEPSPDTALQTQQARNDYESAKKALEYMQQRFDLKLATNDQVLQTKQALEQAQAKMESLHRRGSEGPRTIRADVAGLISKVSVQEGAIIAAGNQMVEMVAQHRLEARMGVDPEYIDKVKPGQEVFLAHVNGTGADKVVGHIHKVSRAADPATRMVQVFVDVPASSHFLLNEYIRGKLTVASAQGLIVPRSALLPQEDHYVLFTVKDGHAWEHIVRVGLENGKDAEVVAKELQPGEPVVTLGNYELKNGMAIKTEGLR